MSAALAASMSVSTGADTAAADVHPAPGASTSVGSDVVSLTSPLKGDIYRAGSQMTIAWTNPRVQTISQIVLVTESDNGPQPVTTVAEDVDAQSGSYEWTVPDDLTEGLYRLEVGTPPDAAYSGQFWVERPDLLRVNW
ncbi:GPI anchored serine-threonine rich family protein [Streptomyces noursei]|uniref:GPI anchored serine-threonine rich family protein n=1 Tax=Streptomyces noursei TaxID=1971 RepID=UPI00167A0E14|nr:GPI anchored serine-threonine rich family protein [Streptomyces noursei]MCZ1020116.1 GPI anchored serine-threonine rich family protein [Streptomyces noursei]